MRGNWDDGGELSGGKKIAGIKIIKNFYEVVICSANM